MNILMLAPDFYPVWGGSGTYTTQIAKNMPKEHFLHILTPKRTQFGDHIFNSNNYLDSLPENIQIHYMGESKDTFFYNFMFQLNCWRNLAKIIKYNDIDIIHSQSSMPDLFISQKKVKIPIVTTIHTTIEGQINAIQSSEEKFNSLDFSEKMTLLSGKFLKFTENRYYNSNRSYITVSNYSKNRVIEEKNINEQKIKVIYNGLDVDRFKVSMKESGKLFFDLYDIDAPKILFLSRLIKSKGIEYLIKSLPEILKRDDVHFIFAGPGKDPKLDIPQENYSILGYVPYEKTPYLHKLSDIFILPSLYENFPMSILEAMASDSGVIATNVGGIPEMVNSKNGILIPPKNRDSITKSILKLIRDDELRDNMAKNAKKTVKNDFNLDKNMKMTINYYEEVLESEGCPC